MLKNKWVRAALVGLTLLSGGAVFVVGQLASKPAQAGYVCPLTGERLPCEKCCPMNHAK